MKKKNLVLGIIIFSMVAMLNILTLTNTNNGILDLTTIQTAMAIDCPEGTPENQNKESDIRDCFIYCTNFWHMGSHAGHELVCIAGCENCSPIDCDAECPTGDEKD